MGTPTRTRRHRPGTFFVPGARTVETGLPPRIGKVQSSLPQRITLAPQPEVPPRPWCLSSGGRWNTSPPNWDLVWAWQIDTKANSEVGRGSPLGAEPEAALRPQPGLGKGDTASREPLREQGALLAQGVLEPPVVPTGPSAPGFPASSREEPGAPSPAECVPAAGGRNRRWAPRARLPWGRPTPARHSDSLRRSCCSSSPASVGARSPFVSPRRGGRRS
ncbi:uncharacterized protein LOC124227116 [Equus quagga]|uniref:uncharacterized protein LOC124227116 n=1 Tax=Equus quagga TaxID=89248 RepID=UPI001EE1D957|nr:uncharacterized protein LOC124227116 [Equus quagga]